MTHKQQVLFVFSVSFLAFSNATAQVPNIMPITAYLTDDSGQALDGSFRVEVALFADQFGSDALIYEEIRPDLAIASGAVNLLVGAVTPLDLTRFENTDQVWLQLTIDGESLRPRLRLGTVPYAAVSANAERLGGLEPEDYALAAETQRRIVGPCPADEAASDVLEDGSLVCTPVGAGPAGPAGPMGPTGPRGMIGPVGPSGAPGPTGPTGAQGLIGATGPQGLPGIAGAQGPIGAAGPQGPPGAAGASGPIGATGPQGLPGVAGPTGPMGPQGLPGATGPEGAAGPAGSPGAQGPPGATGPDGSIGPAGPQGVAGAVGPPGPTGAQGPTGPQGLIGLTGTAGPQGPAGLPGAVGPAGPVGPQGPQGGAGPIGPQGPPGPAGGTSGQSAFGFGSSSWTITTNLGRRPRYIRLHIRGTNARHSVADWFDDDQDGFGTASIIHQDDVGQMSGLSQVNTQLIGRTQYGSSSAQDFNITTTTNTIIISKGMVFGSVPSSGLIEFLWVVR